ncbi:hypothetical protein Droror1_Dr00009125 [Drosera rotundifolia]
MAQSSFGEIGIAVKVYGSMPRKNIMSSNVLVSGLLRNGDLRVHGSCSTKCLNGMIAGLVREGRFEEGLGLFVEMIGEGFSPDGFSLGSLVSGWAGLEGLGIGRQVHSYDGDRFGFKIELDEIRFNSVVFILICGCCCCCCFVEVEVVVALVEIDHVFESRIVLL